MKKYAFLIAVGLLSSMPCIAQTLNPKPIINAIEHSLSQSQTSENPDLRQPIVSVKGHYNPFTGTTFIINFAELATTEQLNKQLLNLASEEKKASFHAAQHEAKTLSHHVYQLERKIKAIEKGNSNAEQLTSLRHQLSELTFSKAKINNQYRNAKMAVFNDIIGTNTVHNIERQLSANVCHLNDQQKQSLNTLTLVLVDVQNSPHEITWHFSDLFTCQDNSLAEQIKFANTKQVSRF
ncbi:hypothetical protein [Pseudoalteromonas piratica]|uniref:Uncharacterized protein n=1 Tax=Pseudoalteromonas piratica TaxID=1348114 RepID=A0A0A7EM74_9GAMM|nr:hypothetical protein [Pseudoalteromonas piratica]AIY67613.1 hypothetical protein OM33_21755 [Pseudoalteromonas piratica]